MAPSDSGASPPDSQTLDDIVVALKAERTRWRTARDRDNDSIDREFPSRQAINTIFLELRGVLFPLRLGPADLLRDDEDAYVKRTLEKALTALVDQVRLELSLRERRDHRVIEDAAIDEAARALVRRFAAQLPALRRILDTDVEAAFRGDPAAQSVDEVLLCYPGILALIHHRLAHALYALELPLIARIVAELAHSETGIDIHPGANIGAHFFIDHGTGVVIGETAVIGDRVRLYQHVTLGAKQFETEADGSLKKGQARHPIVEDDVVIYAGATILGRITIGKGSVIGGNVWLTRDVPEGSQVLQARSTQEATQRHLEKKQIE